MLRHEQDTQARQPSIREAANHFGLTYEERLQMSETGDYTGFPYVQAEAIYDARPKSIAEIATQTECEIVGPKLHLVA